MTIRWRTAAAIATTPPPAAPFLCERLQLGRGRPALCVAGDGTGKSLVFLQIAIEIAAGLPVLGSLAATAMRSTFVDFEVGEEVIDARARRIALGIGVDLSALGDRFRFCSFPEPDLQRGIGELLDEVAGGFAVFDTLSAGMPDEEENGRRMARPLVEMARWSQRTGAVAVVLAHPGHKSPRVRGSTAIRAAAGVEWRLRALPKRSDLVLTTTKAHPLARSLASDIALRIQDTANGGVRVVAPVAPVDPRLAAEILRAVEGGAHSRRKAYVVVGGNRDEFEAAVDAMLRAQTLSLGPTARGGHPSLVIGRGRTDTNAEAAE